MKQSRQENLIYLVVWGLLFAAPLLSFYVRTMSDTDLVFDWAEVFLVWRKFAVYLLLFLIHNFFLAPLLVHQRKRMVYFATVGALLVAFSAYQCSHRPEGNRFHQHPTPITHHPSPHQMERPERPEAPDPGMERPDAPEHWDHPDAPQPPQAHDRPMRQHEFRHDGPPPIMGERDIMAVLVLILMLGANLGIKSYFRSRDDRKRLAELEHQNLEQQLEYLRYQINPHFFMNTLNNIHALVDIDPEKAKDTILELSKMMRFVLYEGNKQGVPLSRELEFIRHYIALMQLRYTDKVRIDVSLPVEVSDRQIPPLILITFIENAFKHGVSYQHESFVEVKVSVEDSYLHFECRNSKAQHPTPNTRHPHDDEKGGVGLANVRKRLNLLYSKNYMLSIHDVDDVYSVELNIPLSPITQHPSPNTQHPTPI